MPSPPHKFWHHRGYLPHLDAPGEIQAITFRLADAVPASLIARWRRELEIAHSNSALVTDREKEISRILHHRILCYEDRGFGAGELADHRCAEIVAEAIRYFDGTRYDLLDWCIMPNHVHLLIRQMESHRLPDVVRSWKTFTARKINQLLGRNGPLWGRDYYDRYIRNEVHLAAARNYIRNNPVKAGLCQKPEAWPWSAGFHTRPSSISRAAQG